jgi:serine/threonine protein kinase
MRELYDFKQVLGRCQKGAVRKAVDKKTSKPVAIKSVKKERFLDTPKQF